MAYNIQSERFKMKINFEIECIVGTRYCLRVRMEGNCEKLLTNVLTLDI